MEHTASSKDRWKWVQTAAYAAGGRQPVPALGKHGALHRYASSRDAQQHRARGN